MRTSNSTLQDHPVKRALDGLGKSPSWLAKQARPEAPRILLIRICDVFSGRRPNFSKRDGLDIYRVLVRRVPRSRLTVDDVLNARQTKRRTAARGSRSGA